MDTTHRHHRPLSLHKAEVKPALFGEERRDARPRQESQSRAADFVPQLIRLKYVVLQGQGTTVQSTVDNSPMQGIYTGWLSAAGVQRDNPV